VWARSHGFFRDHHLLNLDLEKQHPEWHKDVQHQLYILTPPGQGILHEVHDAAVGDCFGAAKTFMAMWQCFFWPGMLNAVQNYTKGGNTCAWVNQRLGIVGGLLNLLPAAWGHREQSVVAFITDMPTSLSGKDRIVTSVDHFAKWAHWMPCTLTIDAAECAQVFLETIVARVAVLRVIVSDRDMCFTSDYWAEISYRLQRKLLISMPFHPQTDRL